MSNIASILINVNSKQKVKAQDLMILITQDDKKQALAKELKAGFAKFNHKVKKK